MVFFSRRLSFLQSLLEPESQKHDWLELALAHDAPQHCDTTTPEGKPRSAVGLCNNPNGFLMLCPLSGCDSCCRWHSHCFSWGYGRLLSLLIRLPADLSSKRKMAETCRSHGYWMGYLHLCCELQQRTEAFSTVCHLDDISLLEDPEGKGKVFSLHRQNKPE